MDRQWTLRVCKFAKIQQAEIELAPFMCFLGDNNSGKSYLMSLLWGIITLGKDIFPKKIKDTKSYIKCENWLKDNLNNDTEISEEICGIYIDWYNELLSSKKSKLMKKIFNYKVEVEKIEICNYKYINPISLKWNSNVIIYSTNESCITLPKIDNTTSETLLFINSYICWKILLGHMAPPLHTPIFKSRRMGEPIYFPASRTGFMLTYSQLLEKSLHFTFAHGYLQEDNNNALMLPYIDFLQLLTQFEVVDKKDTKNKFQDIINFIETNMTKGIIKVEKDYVPTIKYTPIGSDSELPLYVSSSVVSEISPILLTLKSNINFKAMIIEEPEAHLHPELQHQMARFLIKLMNKGIPVWITTHSDTIIQHFNNMIKLYNNKDSKKLCEEYSYQKDDILNPDYVRMYQFSTISKKETILEKLTYDANGFAVPSFNHAIKNLVDEVYAFQEDD